MPQQNFTLHVSFSGLCMFVPDARGGANRNTMYVVMPETAGAGSGTPVKRHQLCVVYNRLYEAGMPHAPENEVVCRPMKKTLVLPTAGTPADLGLGPSVANISLTRRAGKKVPPGLLSNPNAKVAGVVTLPSGAAVYYAPGAEWDYPPETSPVQMTPRVDWQIGPLSGSTLTLDVLPQAVTLTAREDHIWIAIYHVPGDELPPNPPPRESIAVGDPPPHFAAYYDLVDADRTAGWPKLNKTRGVSPITCMVVRADL
jgi:hypothetical protein